MRGVNTDDTLVTTLNQALADPRRPDAILATGDLVQDGSRAGYERFRELAGAAGLPVWCLPGNHDAPAIMRDVLSDPPFQYGGTARHGHWSIVLLNTFADNDAGGLLSPAALRDLERALDDNASGHCLIALHHQPVPMGSRWLDSVPLRNAAEFLAICDRYTHVRGIAWGHVHQVSDRDRRGVRLMSTPSTCSQFKPGSEEFALDTLPPGYRWIDLQADGSIATSVVWVE